jgi:NADP-dependent 3-hydroxy acid dehydrogenase YdfG
MPDVKGQLAMVTGASSGLGEATAVRLAELGARVALLARSRAGLDRVAARISGAGGAAFAQPADLADPDAVVAAAEGAPHSIRVVCLYPGAMATHWGTWNAADRDQPGRAAPEDSLPPEDVARYIGWLICAPAHMIVTEAVVAPIRERGWP